MIKIKNRVYKIFKRVIRHSGFLSGLKCLADIMVISVRAPLKRYLKIFDLRIGFELSSFADTYRFYSYDKKEPHIFEWIGKFINNGDTVYDVGANIGSYTVLLSKKYPASEILAFEPGAVNFAKLNRNLYLNGCSNAAAYCLAFSNISGTDKMHLKSMESAQSGHVLGEGSLRGSGMTPVQVQGIIKYSIDDFIECTGKCPEHIKIDVDGFEEQVIDGAVKLLSERNIKTVYIEIDSGKNPGLSGKISSFGFKPVSIRHSSMGASTATYVFEKQ